MVHTFLSRWNIRHGDNIMIIMIFNRVKMDSFCSYFGYGTNIGWTNEI